MEFKVIADELTFNGEELKKGDTFEATFPEVNKLIVQGFVEEVKQTSDDPKPASKKQDTKKKV